MIDYEKKYNEALERAKELIAKWTGKNKDFYTEDYAHIFPELREYEDEMIRKQLLDFLEHLHSQGKTMDFDVWCKADCANWILWVEKQKEQKNPLEDYSRGYNDGYYHGVTDKKRKEQKPVEWSEEDEKMLANLRSTLSNLSVRGLIKKVTEQKYSAWLKSLRPQKKEDLPKWLVDEDYDEKIDGKDFSLHPVGLAYRGFYIPYSDLLKLPREDEK